jgi:cystathionine gamma-lyase
MRFSTTAIHAGQSVDPATGATVIPIHLTTTFTHDELGVHKGYEYTRSGNPTRQALEECLAALEEGRFGLAFASGLAAEAGVLSLLKPGDHVIAGSDLYGGTFRLFEQVYRPYGIDFSYVDESATGSFREAFRRNTRMVWVETPTNPLLKITDIAAVAKETWEKGAFLVVDNTFATPYLQRPLTLGADIVLHSTTKYIGGHSDALGGAVIVNDAGLHERIKFYQNAAGGVPGPFEAWLTLRGVKTLQLRMVQHCLSAERVAHLLAGHPTAAQVYYPGLPSHPHHALWPKQMRLAGGMVSFEIAGGLPAAKRFFSRLKIFSLAESLGGVESLVCHPATMTHASFPPENRAARGITDGLIRLSVGIEDIEDLLTDITEALS